MTKIIVGLGNPGEAYQATRHNLGAEVVKSLAHKHGLFFSKESKFQSLFAHGVITKKYKETICASKNKEAQNELPSEKFRGALKNNASSEANENLSIQEKLLQAKVALLLPLTYMNRSGFAVRKTVDFFKIVPSEKREQENVVSDFNHQLLIVIDELYLEFGTLRLKSMGGSGGHNGLKDIEAHLKTKNYPRLRMGIGPKTIPGGKVELEMPLDQFVLGKFTSQEREVLPSFIEKGVLAIENWIFEQSSTKEQ